MVTEAELKALDGQYKQAIKAAERQRATTIASAIDEGWAQKDVITATGYSRETIRRLTGEGRAAASEEPTT
jgi:F0F1-type ATP synthase membrane subunit b/b'